MWLCRASEAAKEAHSQRKLDRQALAPQKAVNTAAAPQATAAGKTAKQQAFLGATKLSQQQSVADKSANSNKQSPPLPESSHGKLSQPDMGTASAPGRQQLPQEEDLGMYLMPRKRVSLRPQRVELTPSKLRRDVKQQSQEPLTPRQAAQRAQAVAQAVLSQQRAEPAEVPNLNPAEQQELQGRPAAPQKAAMRATKAQVLDMRQQAYAKQAAAEQEADEQVVVWPIAARQPQSKPAAQNKDDQLKVTRKQLQGLRQQAEAMQAVKADDVWTGADKQQKQADGLDEAVLADEGRGKAYLQQALEMAYKSDMVDSSVSSIGQEGAPDAASKTADANEPFQPHSLTDLRSMRMIQELRPLCQQYGLTTTGRKDLLILRILAHEAGLCMSMGL